MSLAALIRTGSVLCSRPARNARCSSTPSAHRLPLLLKGPTGCGKTRFVAHMAARLGAAAAYRLLPRRPDRRRPHRPLSPAGRRDRLDRRAADPRRAPWRHLLSRRGGRGAQGRGRRPAPADRRPPHPAARPHRRDAGRADDFMLVVSYNPGYQSLLKSLKPSTRQRFLAHRLRTIPPEEAELAIVARESGLAPRPLPPAGPAGAAGCAPSATSTWRKAARRACWSTRRR